MIKIPSQLARGHGTCKDPETLVCYAKGTQYRSGKIVSISNCKIISIAKTYDLDLRCNIPLAYHTCLILNKEFNSRYCRITETRFQYIRLRS